METFCSFSPNIRSRVAKLICFLPVSDGFIVMKLLLHCEKGANSWYLSSSFLRKYHYEDDTIDKHMRESGSVLWNRMFQQCFFFLKAAEDVFSFQSESLPEVFCHCRV